MPTLSAGALGMSRIVAEYADQTSEDIVVAYERERENWLRSLSTAQAAKVAPCCWGADHIDVNAAEVLGPAKLYGPVRCPPVSGGLLVVMC
jgi:hypothetical protein